MEAVFDHLVDRRGTHSVKWDYFGDAMPLWVADMDFPSPEPVLKALRERVDHGFFGYTRPMSELNDVICARLQERYNWAVEPDALTFVPGVMSGVNMAARAIGEPGDGVLIQPPVYFPFFHVPKYACRTLQQAEVPQQDGRYQVDYDAFEEAITPSTRLFLLCNPHNPIGRAFSRQEQVRMAEICLQHDVVICSDEIHSELILAGNRHIPIASIAPEIADRTVTVFAPSKTFNIPGLKFSVMVIQNPELREHVLAAGAGMVHGCNLMGYLAGLAAYRDCDDWLTQLLGYLDANRDALLEFVRHRLPGVSMVKPEATYLAWLDCRQANIEGNLRTFFLEEAGVALNDGEMFGPGGEGFVRLNFACPRDHLMQALTQMEKALLEKAAAA